METLYPTANQKRINSNYYVEGYATTFEPYVLYIGADGKPVYELIERTAFNGCDMLDIIMQYNHEGKVFARQSNNTLLVDIDNKGLFCAADLSKSEAAKEMYEEINCGLVTKMSWGFLPGEYHFDRQTNTIVHTKIKKIFDVSAVSIPANGNTEIYARAFADGVIVQMQQELLKNEQKRKLLKLKLMLGGITNGENRRDRNKVISNRERTQ